MTEVKLTKPIKAHNEELSALNLREPTGEDLTLCGLPLTQIEGGQKVDTQAMTKLISLLAAIPTSSVKMLSAGDYLRVTTEVLGFFA